MDHILRHSRRVYWFARPPYLRREKKSRISMGSGGSAPHSSSSIVSTSWPLHPPTDSASVLVPFPSETTLPPKNPRTVASAGRPSSLLALELVRFSPDPGVLFLLLSRELPPDCAVWAPVACVSCCPRFRRSMSAMMAFCASTSTRSSSTAEGVEVARAPASAAQDRAGIAAGTAAPAVIAASGRRPASPQGRSSALESRPSPPLLGTHGQSSSVVPHVSSFPWRRFLSAAFNGGREVFSAGKRFGGHLVELFPFFRRFSAGELNGLDALAPGD